MGKLSLFNRLKRFLQRWDVLWSAPLAFLAFIAFAVVGEQVFGFGFGGYDPSIYQAAIYAAGIVVLFNGVILIGLNMNWRTFYSYYITDSKNDFKNLPSWLKIGLLLLQYWLYFCVLMIVFLKLV
jgi:hypothetical protein